MAHGLSIFSSERWQRARWVDAGVYCWGAVLAAGVVGLTLLASVLLNALVRPREPLARRSLNFANGQILVLGNSQLRAIRPEVLAFPAADLAIGGSDYAIQDALLASIAPEMPKLKVVVVGLDNIPLLTPAMKKRRGDFTELMDLGMDWWRLPDLSLGRRLGCGFRNIPLFRPLFASRKLDVEQIGKLARRSAQPPPVETSQRLLPTQVHPGFEFAPVDGERKMERYVQTLREEHNLANNWRHYLNILKYCAGHGLKLALVRTPTTSEFWRARPRAWDEQAAEMISQANAILPANQIRLWDLERNASFEVDSFRDPNHLSPEGAVRLTQLCNEFLTGFIVEPQGKP